MLLQEKAVGAYRCLRRTGAAARESDQRGGIRGAREYFFSGRQGPGAAPRNRARQSRTDNEFARNGPQRRRNESEQVGLRTSNKHFRGPQAAASFDVFAAGRWIEEHRNRTETECSNQGCVELGRHAVKNEDSVTCLHAGALQERSGASRLQVEIGKAQRAVVAVVDVQNSDCVRVRRGMAAKNLSDVHRESCLANSV